MGNGNIVTENKIQRLDMNGWSDKQIDARACGGATAVTAGDPCAFIHPFHAGSRTWRTCLDYMHVMTIILVMGDYYG